MNCTQLHSLFQLIGKPALLWENSERQQLQPIVLNRSSKQELNRSSKITRQKALIQFDSVAESFFQLFCQSKFAASVAVDSWLIYSPEQAPILIIDENIRNKKLNNMININVSCLCTCNIPFCIRTSMCTFTQKTTRSQAMIVNGKTYYNPKCIDEYICLPNAIHNILAQFHLFNNESISTYRTL